MDRFRSTRGAGPVPLETAIYTSLADDGGLYLPEPPPTLPGAPPLDRNAGFRDVASWCAEQIFGGVLGAGPARAIASSALDFPAPLVEVEPGFYVLELFHGPSLAFKDVGARFMASLMAHLHRAADDTASRTVLVATSGDTGGAVASAFLGQRGISVVVLFPREGVSARQRRQMTTLGDNVRPVEVDGTFDDCQALAKQAFGNTALAARHRLTSANSINVGRLLPQAFCYVAAAHRLGWDRPARYVVPSGNLGNLCAGLIAHQAGMPALGFVGATNRNAPLTGLLEGRPPEDRRSEKTHSNAMDVARPSNWERIDHLFADDRQSLRELLHTETVGDEDTVRTIADVHARTGYVLDPHSAVAYRAAQRAEEDRGPVVVLGTAHPAKFPHVVEAAIGEPVLVPERLAALMEKEERMERIPATHDALAALLNEGAR